MTAHDAAKLRLDEQFARRYTYMGALLEGRVSAAITMAADCACHDRPCHSRPTSDFGSNHREEEWIYLIVRSRWEASRIS